MHIIKNEGAIYKYHLHFRNGETKTILCTQDLYSNLFVYTDETYTTVFSTRYPLQGEKDITILLSFYFFNEEAQKFTTEVINLKTEEKQ